MRQRSLAKLPMLLGFLVPGWAMVGCTGQVPSAKQAQAHAVSGPKAAALSPAAAPSTPAETLALADLAYESQLGASRGQFSVDRQVAVLKQEVLLYTQFLERAEGQPELEPAVRKSRERIADAKATLIFLENQRAEGEPPVAPSE